MPTKNSSKSFEKKLKDLEAIVVKIEEGALSLEESLSAYEKGIKLVNECRSSLNEAEHKVNTLSNVSSTNKLNKDLT